MLESAPQPDACLRIRPSSGGQSQEGQTYLMGAPELAVEICVSSADHDFAPKLALYQRAGVREYVTLETFRNRVTWRVLRDGSYVDLQPGEDKIYRSTVFPGLWLDAEALFSENGPRLLQALQQGLSSPEHHEFITSLNPR